MHFQKSFISLLLFIFTIGLYAQTETGKSYRIDRYESVYLPLGKISFADSLVSYQVGTPAPIQKYRDSIQCLHEPNYTKYLTPNFMSLGCGGSLTVAFTDNGFMNLKGKDLYIFEVGPSREPAKVEISENGVDWIYAGKISGGKSSIDLSEEKIDTETVFRFLRITDLKKLCKSKSAGADIDAIGAINSVMQITINADVLFDVAEFNLKSSSNETLIALVKSIQKIDKASVLVEGHTDSDGSDEYNRDLSEKRCNSVVDKLKELFGDTTNYGYDIKAFGESKPRVANDSKENKQSNRRVEIKVLPPKSYYDSLPEKD